MKNKECFNLAFDDDSGNLEVILAEVITEWATLEFIRDIKGVKDLKSVHVLINTNGGSVTAGLAIFNVLKSLKVPVTTEVLGIAASMGAVVLQAGDKRIAPENSFVMIHNTWGVAIGESPELRKLADLLDAMTQMTVNIFTSSTGLDEEKIIEMLDEETTMSGNQALELGFVDEVTNPIDIAASIDSESFTNLPDEAKQLLAKNKKGRESMNKEKELQASNDQLTAELSTAKEDLGKAKAAETEAHEQGIEDGRNEILENRVKARMEKYSDAAFVLETIGEEDDAVANAYIKKLEASQTDKDAEIKKLKDELKDPEAAGQTTGAEGDEFDQKAYDARVSELRAEGKSAKEAHIQTKKEMPEDKKQD